MYEQHFPQTASIYFLFQIFAQPSQLNVCLLPDLIISKKPFWISVDRLRGGLFLSFFRSAPVGH